MAEAVICAGETEKPGLARLVELVVDFRDSRQRLRRGCPLLGSGSVLEDR
jgi:hypothetical protein